MSTQKIEEQKLQNIHPPPKKKKSLVAALLKIFYFKIVNYVVLRVILWFAPQKGANAES